MENDYDWTGQCTCNSYNGLVYTGGGWLLEMKLNHDELNEIISFVVTKTLDTLEERGLIRGKKDEKTAYQKTEQLLYNYRGFKRIVGERLQEIEDLKKFGVPTKSKSIVEYVPHADGTVQGIVLDEESVQDAIASVQASVQSTVQVISKIDRCMAQLRNDPYYCILEMRYFEGRTQEDIALELKCAQQTVSKNKNRLVRELSMRLFPDQVAQEMLE